MSGIVGVRVTPVDDTACKPREHFMTTPWKVLAASLVILAGLIALLMWRPSDSPRFGGSREATGNGGSRQAPDDREHPLVLYCAAGTKPPVKAVVQEYMEEQDVDIQLQYGGSGTLLSNLQVSKTADIYLAADQTYIDLAQEKGLLAEVLPVAHQRPVIAVRKGNPKDIRAISDLLREDVKVALGSPDAASIGKQTRAVLQRTGDWSALEAHVKKGGVFKPTVPEVANDVKIGAVDAGITWDTTLALYPELEAVRFPAFDEAPQLISVAVLEWCDQPTRALHFARYLTARDRGLLHFQKMGYDVVDGDVWADRPEIVLFSGGVNRVAIQRTLKEFEHREGVDIITNFNGCGILVGEMKTGKRPDAYFACDASYLTSVHDLFLDETTISETDMVILTRKGNPKEIHTLQDLTRPGIKIAVANPEYSALGGLTRQLLEEAGIYEQVRENITYGDAPTADYVASRVKLQREDVGIVYRANTLKLKDELEVISVGHSAAKAVQPIAVGRNSPHRHLVQRLVDALKSAESRRRFEASGFRWASGSHDLAP